MDRAKLNDPFPGIPGIFSGVAAYPWGMGSRARCRSPEEPMHPGRPVHDLIQDYLDVLESNSARSLPRDVARKLQGYYRFVTSQGHHLDGHPELVLPLGVAQPVDSPVRTDALAVVGSGQGLTRPCFCLMNPPP